MTNNKNLNRPDLIDQLSKSVNHAEKAFKDLSTSLISIANIARLLKHRDSIEQINNPKNS